MEQSVHEQPERGPMVHITVNGSDYQIHRGHTKVAEIKAAANIPLADDLDQIIQGQLKHLPDDGAVTLKGGEHFVAHPKDGGSA